LRLPFFKRRKINWRARVEQAASLDNGRDYEGDLKRCQELRDKPTLLAAFATNRLPEYIKLCRVQDDALRDISKIVQETLE